MSIGQEAVARYDFWLDYMWDQLRIALYSLALIQVLLLWMLVRSKRLWFLLFVPIVSVLFAWWLSSTALWLLFKVPNSTYHQVGAVGTWILRGTPYAAAAVTFTATSLAYLKVTRWRRAV